MANFTPSKKTAQDFNNGVEYIDYDAESETMGDAVKAETINNVIKSQLWTQALATNPVDNSEANNVGTASIELATMVDGTPRLKVKNIKGEQGVQGKKGDTGDTGNGISSTTISYATSTLGTTPPTTGWQSTIPTVAKGSYLWTRTVITYTNALQSISYTSAYQGKDGTNSGVTGVKGANETVYRTGNVNITTDDIGASTKETAQKNLYNLGAYDTFVSNGDGTVTITRQTGDLKVDSVSGSETTWNANNGYRIVRFNLIDAETFSGQHDIKANIKTEDNNVLYNSTFDYPAISSVDEQKKIIICVGGITTNSELDAYFSKSPVHVQYKLGASYTETVIEQQPIHTLNQEGEQRLREEWSKGLNCIVEPSTNWGQYNIDIGYAYLKPNKTYYLIGYEYTNVGGSKIHLKRKTDNYDFTSYANYGFNLANGGTISTAVSGFTEGLYLVQLQATYSNVTIGQAMLNEGDHAYPYEPYYGEIIRKKDLTPIQYTSNSFHVQNQMDTVVEYFRSSNGTSWFRIWASGWKECGGVVKRANIENGISTITLFTSFASANYTLLITTQRTSGTTTNTSIRELGYANKTISQFTVYRSTNSDYDAGFDWYACGY